MVDKFFQLPTYILFIVFFTLIVISNWLGYIYKKKKLEKYPATKQEDMGSIEGSILGLMSLLMGFTFSVAVYKFEARRHIIVDEANIIGTAILRADMYPDSVRIPLRESFKQYVESRIAYYEAGTEADKIQEELNNAERLSMNIWKTVIFHSHDERYRLRSMEMIPILNDMIDIITTRDVSRANRVPPLIVGTLLFLVVAAAFLLGSDYRGHKRNYMLLVGYCIVMTVTLNLINELNHPREGFVNLNDVEIRMEELRKHFL
jgi:hypothetical protein